MLEPAALREAEIVRARTAFETAKWRVAQDKRVYGVAHVSKLNRLRFVTTGQYLMYLLHDPSASVTE